MFYNPYNHIRLLIYLGLLALICTILIFVSGIFDIVHADGITQFQVSLNPDNYTFNVDTVPVGDPFDGMQVFYNGLPGVGTLCGTQTGGNPYYHVNSTINLTSYWSCGGAGDWYVVLLRAVSPYGYAGYYHFYATSQYVWSLTQPPAEPTVSATSPASGSEITDLDSTISVSWGALDDYDSLYLTFQNKATGIYSGSKSFSISTIGTSGTMSLPLSDFNIQNNGDWYFYAMASYQGYNIENGMFLSGQGSQFTGDLTDGDYYLNINVEGLTLMFDMDDFGSWYSAHVERFEAPTAEFSAIADALHPIFSFIGEFGSKVSAFFDNNNAYQKGFDMGKSIPVFSYYLGQVAFFLGGFPLINTFLLVIFVMVGIFIFRLVVSFIPRR